MSVPTRLWFCPVEGNRVKECERTPGFRILVAVRHLQLSRAKLSNIVSESLLLPAKRPEPDSPLLPNESPSQHSVLPDNGRLPLSDFVIGFAVADIILISLILCLCLWAAWNPVSRRHLNRVSFRLLIYALVANLACSGCIICAVKLGPGAACAGTAFFADACILFAAVMFFSMALNLQLVIVHGVNGQKMEKYYLSAATTMALACNIPPYAAEVVMRTGVGSIAKPPLYEYDGIYPLVSCFFIITTGALDLNSILNPVRTEVNWRLNILDLLLYALRPMTYTLLAATDHSKVLSPVVFTCSTCPPWLRNQGVSQTPAGHRLHCHLELKHDEFHLASLNELRHRRGTRLH
ncbi:hypothetical protein B0H16DRAFT_1456729 [Mycena metata]|uniref:Uncharacterized protein n=1 Tax=Mycena metata TaxID=1033252 RepID=A0AAD7NHC1_9AGAR|nr:hypothetical protein B0H16DRAFT_1456729 [Mycena metata]